MKFLAFRTPADLAQIPADACVIGVEVPPTAAQAVRERCGVIIDPQHTEGAAHCAALEVKRGAYANQNEYAPIKMARKAISEGREVWLITPRFDLDAGCAMALLKYEVESPGCPGYSEDMVWRIDQIDAADTFAAGAAPWPGRRPLPTVNEPWPNVGGAGEVATVAAPNHITGWTWSGPKLSLDVVVEGLLYWLFNGELGGGEFENPVAAAKEAASKRDFVTLIQAAACDARQARVEIATALADSTLKPEEHDGFVFFDMMGWRGTSTSTAGVGYCLSPVTAVELFDGRAKCRRFSVAAYNRDALNFGDFVAEANVLETSGGRWGGAPGSCMIGSPQDRETSLSHDQFIKLVAKHVKRP